MQGFIIHIFWVLPPITVVDAIVPVGHVEIHCPRYKKGLEVVVQLGHLPSRPQLAQLQARHFL